MLTIEIVDLIVIENEVHILYINYYDVFNLRALY